MWNAIQANLDDLKAAYTSEQYTAGTIWRLGAWFIDPKTAKKYIFVKNSGSSSITARLIAMSLTTSKRTYNVTLAAATDALIPFAGVRVAGATALAQNEYGWLQVGGPAEFLHSGGAATVAEEYIVSSASVAGKIEGGAPTVATVASLAGGFAIAEAAYTTLDDVVYANIVKNIWGL